jgi:hypothetical protein
MEKKIVSSNKVILDKKLNKRNIIITNQSHIKSFIKNFKLTKNEQTSNKSEMNYYTKTESNINKQKKCTNNIYKEIKDNNIKKLNKIKEKEKEKIFVNNNSLNKSEIKSNNKTDTKFGNIRVNKINFDINDGKNKMDIYTNSNTNYRQINYIHLKNKKNKNSEGNNLKNITNEYSENKDESDIQSNKNIKKSLLYNFSNELICKYNNRTAIVRKRIGKEEPSKKQIKFKDMKTFLAHIEIFMSLYLKKIFNYFLQKIQIYDKPKENPGIYNNNSYHLRPIVNVNNSHCSLYCSINVNQDKLINTLLNNKHFSSFSQNINTPINKKKQNKIENNIEIKSNDNNIIKRNRNFPINSIGINLKTENSPRINNKFNIISKKNSNEDNNEKIFDKNDSNNNIKISPIKELNINLGQLNFFKFSLNKQNEINNNKFENNINSKSNLLNKIKSCKENLYQINFKKNKLQTIKSAKNDIYIKPKETQQKKPIKEIKIQNKLTTKNNYLNINSYNNFHKINNKISKRNCHNEDNIIKKIYIKRGNQMNNNFDYSTFSHYNSTFINYKADNEKNINDVLLIKEIQTLDKRIFINIKYIQINKNNNINRFRKKFYNGEKVQIVRLYSISINNNQISLNKELYENLKMYNLNNYKDIADYCFFDNDKNKNLKNLVNLINKIKIIIFKKILRLLSKAYSKKSIIKTLLIKNYKKNIKRFFLRFIKNTLIQKDKNQKVIYHKINYNDDFNTNNRFQTPKNIDRFKKINNTKSYNLTYKNSNNQINFSKILIDKHTPKESFSNFKK